MAYNSIITSAGSTGVPPAAPSGAPLIPLEYADQIISLIPAQSVARKLFRNINMGHAMLQVPVLDSLPQAYWVGNQGIAAPGTSGSAGSYNALQQTTSMAWKGVQLTANTVAVDVPIPRVTLADSMFPIWAEVVPMVAGALALALDAAVIFGYNSPFTAPALIPGALSVGNVFTLGTETTATGGIANDISQLLNLVEAGSGFNITGIIASKALKVVVRNARTTFGQELGEVDTSQWYETDVDYLAAPGLWPQAPASSIVVTTVISTPNVTLTTGTTATLSPGDSITGAGIPAGTTILSITDSTHLVLDANATASATGVAIAEVNPVAVVGDFSQAILGTRQDLNFQIFDTGVIQDSSGNIVLNLMQQDAVNLRVTARFGYAVANSVTYYQPTESARYPFAALLA